MKRKLLFLSKITLLMVMISFADNVFAFDFGGLMKDKGYSIIGSEINDYELAKPNYVKGDARLIESAKSWSIHSIKNNKNKNNIDSLYPRDLKKPEKEYITAGVDYIKTITSQEKNKDLGGKYYIIFKKLYTIDGQDVDVKVTLNKLVSSMNSVDLGDSEVRIYLHEKSTGYKYLGFGIFNTKDVTLPANSEFSELAYVTIELLDSKTGAKYASDKTIYYFKDIDGGSHEEFGFRTELASVLNVDKKNIYLTSKKSALKINDSGIISSTTYDNTDDYVNPVSFLIKDSTNLQNNGTIALAFGEYMHGKQTLIAKKGRVGQTDIQFVKKRESTCDYNNPSDFQYNRDGVDCCQYISDRLNAVGKSVEQFKEDYPLCFDGKKVNYTVSTPKCERADNDANNSQKTAYIRPTTESLSQDNWIWLLKNNTVSSTDIGTGTCNLVCYEKIELSLPLFPYGSIQPGQHFVWPNNNPNNKFEYRPLTSKTTKVCRVMTNKVIDDATKSACQSKFDISKTGLDSATISIKYNNSPYSANEKLSVSKDSKTINNSEYGVYYKNSNLGNRNSATQYTISSNSTYSLPKTLFAYTPKNKLELPKSSIGSAEASKYVNVGYGNLPVSLDWERKIYVSNKAWKYDVKTYTVGLNVQTPQIGNKKISYDYTCKFAVDDYGQNGKSCPTYSQKPGQNPKGFQECMTKYDYGTCVANYCYNKSSKPYCPKDCTNGVCRESKETLAFRACIAHGGVGYGAATCMARECPQSTAAVYRTISLDNPFPGFSGNGRKAGYNWSNPSIVKKYITDTKKYYDKQPMYEITLGPKAITEIRNYNSNAVGGYLDFNLNCTNGKECRSDFIRTKFKKYFSNTCGMSTKWNACDSR